MENLTFLTLKWIKSSVAYIQLEHDKIQSKVIKSNQKG